MGRLIATYAPKGEDILEVVNDQNPPKWTTPLPASSAVSHSCTPIVPQGANAYTLSGIYPVYEEPPVVMGGGHAYTLSGINPIYEPHTLSTTIPPIAVPVPVLIENPMNALNISPTHSQAVSHQNTSNQSSPTLIKMPLPDYSMMAGPDEQSSKTFSRLRGAIKK